MFLTDAGYSAAQFNPAALREVVAKLRRTIPFLLEECKAEAIAVTGKSGLSMAFATLAHIDFNLMVIRKDGKQSHGESVEGPPSVDVRSYIILDDFVSSGKTLNNIVNGVDAYHAKRDGYYPDMPERVGKRPDCVGVIEWNRKGSSSSPKQRITAVRGEFEVPCFTADAFQYVRRFVEYGNNAMMNLLLS